MISVTASSSHKVVEVIPASQKWTNSPHAGSGYIFRYAQASGIDPLESVICLYINFITNHREMRAKDFLNFGIEVKVTAVN